MDPPSSVRRKVEARRQPQLVPVSQRRTGNVPPDVVAERPSSPRDTTPLVSNGQEIPRESIPPIREESLDDVAEPHHRQDIPPIQELPEEEVIRPASPVPLPPRKKATAPPRKVTITPPRKVTITPPRKKATAPPRKTSVPPRGQGIPPPPRKQAPLPQKKPQPKKMRAPDFKRMTQVQRIAALAQYKKKFSNVRESFPNMGVAAVPEDMAATPENLLKLHTEYDEYLTHIIITEDVTQNMLILILVLGGVELFLTKVVGLPASGYVLKQMGLMAKYKSLLYEIGEERVANSGGRSSPLVRLIYTILLTSVATVCIRLFESTITKAGADMAENFVFQYLGGGSGEGGGGGGLNMGDLLSTFGGLFGGGGGAAAPKQEAASATRGPLYDE